jgi:hypothetical protein
VHDNVVLGGPVWWFVAALIILAGLLGAFAFFDSLFVRRAAFERLREPRWAYSLVQGVYLLVLLTAQVPGVPPLVGGYLVLATPFAIAISIAYLLRAVFPRSVASDEPVAPGCDEAHSKA